MSGEIILQGGPANTEDLVVGALGEIRVDSSNKDIRLHDGTTPGGRLIINRDNGDERWHPKSVELAGIGPFSADARGFLTRRGAGDYRLRKITVSTELAVEFADGYGGDPIVKLSGLVTQDMTFEGDVLVEGVMQVDGGINANTYGEHTGNVIGNMIGNVAGNLTGDSAGKHTGNTYGDHIGGINASAGAVVFADNSLQLSWINGLLPYIKTNGIPIGAIVMWSGSMGAIPAGWALCNGVNGTPNLLDRMIVAAGNAYAIGATGGAASASGTTSSNGAHSHAGSGVNGHSLSESEMPSHSHGLPAPAPQVGGGYGYTGATGVTGGQTYGTNNAGGGAPHSHGLNIVAVDHHNHTFAVDTRPPYFALAFIMHVG